MRTNKLKEIVKNDAQFKNIEKLYLSILNNRGNIIHNSKDSKVIHDILGEGTVAKVDQIQAENEELKLTIQNLVVLLREESNRCK